MPSGATGGRTVTARFGLDRWGLAGADTVTQWNARASSIASSHPARIEHVFD
jgi:hypothetical protein